MRCRNIALQAHNTSRCKIVDRLYKLFFGGEKIFENLGGVFDLVKIGLPGKWFKAPLQQTCLSEIYKQIIKVVWFSFFFFSPLMYNLVKSPIKDKYAWSDGMIAIACAERR